MVFRDYFPWIVPNIGGQNHIPALPLQILGGGRRPPPWPPGSYAYVVSSYRTHNYEAHMAQADVVIPVPPL